MNKKITGARLDPTAPKNGRMNVGSCAVTDLAFVYKALQIPLFKAQNLDLSDFYKKTEELFSAFREKQEFTKPVLASEEILKAAIPDAAARAARPECRAAPRRRQPELTR